MNVTPCDVAAIPRALADYPNWVGWRAETRGGKPTKVPVNIHTGRLALSNSACTWATLEEALPFVRREGCGLGFVFSPDDPFAGIDLDDCIEEEARRVKPWAWEIVTGLNSYTEVSPSGLGLKIIVRATLPSGRRGWGSGHGMYDRARFFTLTGLRLPDLPSTIEERTAAVAALHTQLFPPPPPLAQGAGTPTPVRRMDDHEVVQRAMSAVNGPKFARLWFGDRSGYNSDSEADAALCSMLAWWIGPDADRLDGLFRQSQLYREKWERPSYRDKTLALALRRTDYYDPNRTITVLPQRRGGGGRRLVPLRTAGAR